MLRVVKTRAAVQKKATATDLNTPQAVKEFREAAEAFTAKLQNAGRAEALRILAEEGIYTRTGRLSKRYR